MAKEFKTEDKLQYQFVPVKFGELNFKVRARSDVHVALTPFPTKGDPMYEIVIGGWSNTKSIIRRNRVLPGKAEVLTPYIASDAEYHGFWIRWEGGLVEVGKEGELSPFLKWKDPEPFDIRYYGISTGYGATGSWIKEEFKTGEKLEYQFIPAISGEMNFKVRATNDAYVLLTTAPTTGDPTYEIVIGGWGNSKSVIRRNRAVLVAEANTHKFLSGTEYRGFWIRWCCGLVEVGQEGETCPFLKWKDPEPIDFCYYGVCTAWGATGSWLTEEFETKNKLEYHFIPVISGELHFRVRATNDAHVALTTGPSAGDPMYEIMIGGWKNTKSVIRRNRVKPDKAEIDTPYILSDVEYHGFWIRWKGGLVEVGKEGEPSPFLKWKDPEPFDVRYYGICTAWGATGSWITGFKTEDKVECLFKPITTTTKVNFKVRAPKDAHVALPTGPTEKSPVYEIIIGGSDNTKSVIRRNNEKPDKAVVDTPRILSNEEYRGFWIRYKDGLVEVGKETKATPFLKWKDPEGLSVDRRYGISTRSGTTGSWITEEFKTEDKFEYNFTAVTSGRLRFKVRAPNDAHVALTTGPTEGNPMYEIFIGGWKNTKSVIRRNRVKPDKAEADTPNILSAAEYRDFWIRWGGGVVEVGKEKEVTPFLKWKDPEPFDVRYYGFCTGWGATGSWITGDRV